MRERKGGVGVKGGGGGIREREKGRGIMGEEIRGEGIRGEGIRGEG